MLFTVKEPHHMLIAFAPIYILSASLLVDLISWLYSLANPPVGDAHRCNRTLDRRTCKDFL